MSEKVEDRLFRLTCQAYGITKKIGELIRAMTDEQLEELFDEALERALQSGEIKVK